MSDTNPTDACAGSAGIDLQSFVLEQNVRLYRKLLSETDDTERRQVLDRLLVEAAAALQWHATHPGNDQGGSSRRPRWMSDA